MTREEAINLEAEVRYSLTASKHKAAVDVAFDALRGVEWISVKDRLPSESGSYLVATKNGGVMITHFYAKSQSFSSTRLNRLITHWMNRPEPPKEDA